jgi:hypothetical protein
VGFPSAKQKSGITLTGRGYRFSDGRLLGLFSGSYEGEGGIRSISDCFPPTAGGHKEKFIVGTTYSHKDQKVRDLMVIYQWLKDTFARVVDELNPEKGDPMAGWSGRVKQDLMAATNGGKKKAKQHWEKGVWKILARNNATVHRQKHRDGFAALLKEARVAKKLELGVYDPTETRMLVPLVECEHLPAYKPKPRQQGGSKTPKKTPSKKQKRSGSKPKSTDEEADIDGDSRAEEEEALEHREQGDCRMLRHQVELSSCTCRSGN